MFLFFSECVKVNATGPSSHLMETEKLSLSCSAQFYSNGKENKDLWKTCIWKRDSDGAACKIVAENDIKTKDPECDTSIEDVKQIGGDRHKCSIEIPEVKLKDNGMWTCSMEKCKDKSDGGCEAKDSGICEGEAKVHIEVNYYFLKSNDQFY